MTDTQKWSDHERLDNMTCRRVNKDICEEIGPLLASPSIRSPLVHCLYQL